MPFVNNFLHSVGKSKGRVPVLGLVEATFLIVPVELRGESCISHLSKACNGLLNYSRHFFVMRLPRSSYFKTHD